METCQECKSEVEATGICDACAEEGCEECLVDDPEGGVRHDACSFED